MVPSRRVHCGARTTVFALSFLVPQYPSLEGWEKAPAPSQISHKARALARGCHNFSPPSILLPAALFPDGRSVGDKIFRTANSEKPFEDAQEICRQAGGQLASPRSDTENVAIQQLITAHNKAAFLSMTDVGTEGKFTYPSGEPLVYSNWAPGEPNNNGGAENCVEIFTNGQWNDKACGEQRLVICEF